MSVWSQSWLIWCGVVVVGLPVLSIFLAEVETNLERRRSSMTRPLHVFRTYVLPLAALVVLLAVIPDDIVANDSNWFKIAATGLGLLLLNFAISSLNTALFVNADRGSWRKKLPSIFIDIARIIIIAIGLAILFSWVWGADVGGIFTALGVTSIVIGLALQTAIGSIVAGLLLLFEQPFTLGDWLDAGGVKGRVVEVNWRAVHIQTDAGLQIVPNSSLAGASFTNLSRPNATVTETIESAFAKEDSPAVVMATLQGVADAIPGQLPGSRPDVSFVGAGRFTTSFTLGTFAAAGEARAQFQLRLWYAARRANIALDGADIWKDESADDVLDLLRQAASRLHIKPEQLDELAPRLDLERFAPGEIIDQIGRVPGTVRWIADGQARVTIPYGRAGTISPLTLSRGDLTGLTALTKQPSAYTCVAATELTVLTVPAEVLDELARHNVRLSRDIGQDIDRRGQQLTAAVENADRQLTTSSTSPSSPPATAGIVRR
ncbi:hypothetical protein BA895_19650 [Humibacillus sp. DSM 29435]|uniref:mechanosensitive ion channel family protein n=1 Tax=Humibacillus sp. DSM 29435 TaxID=1869167 RepID=UPI000872D30F|nr:mechanosensitive ion channel family protein [Humibacillus sp. DSM 29435]OFE16270.1 hypothetical protein BA895_19650 [Humibacillus sp. DSM 29435]